MPARFRLAFAAAAAAAIGLLTGCTPQATEVQPVGIQPTSSPTATPTAEPLQLEDLEVGAPLTPAQAKELNGMRGTLRPYELADGSFIVLDVKKPLPEPVKQEVAQRLGSVGNDTGSALGALDRETASGKTIIMVRQIHYSDAYGNNAFGWHAASYANGFPGFRGSTAEDVATQSQTWVDSQRDPTQFEIIVVPN